MTIWDALKELFASPFVVFIAAVLLAAVVTAVLADRRERRADEAWRAALGLRPACTWNIHCTGHDETGRCIGINGEDVSRWG